MCLHFGWSDLQCLSALYNLWNLHLTHNLLRVVLCQISCSLAQCIICLVFGSKLKWTPCQFGDVFLCVAPSPLASCPANSRFLSNPELCSLPFPPNDTMALQALVWKCSGKKSQVKVELALYVSILSWIAALHCLQSKACVQSPSKVKLLLYLIYPTLLSCMAAGLVWYPLFWHGKTATSLFNHGNVISQKPPHPHHTYL